MVGAAHGLDTSTYTVPCDSTWTSNVPSKSPVDVVQATAERVRGASPTVLDNLDTPKVNDGNPPGLDREALSTHRQTATVKPMTRSTVEMLGR